PSGGPRRDLERVTRHQDGDRHFRRRDRRLLDESVAALLESVTPDAAHPDRPERAPVDGYGCARLEQSQGRRRGRGVEMTGPQGRAPADDWQGWPGGVPRGDG